MDPLVSIIIPIYNSEKYIFSTIESCIKQSYTHIEIILINDGSVDGTEDIILSFNDDRIRYYKITNVGSCEARNFGISVANGSLYQFLDHDDTLDSNKIQSQLEYYKKYGDDYIYSCNMGTISNDTKSVDVGYELYARNFTPIEYFETLLNQFGKYITTGAWLIPSKILKSTDGWNSKCGINDDGEYSMRLILNSKGIIFCKEGIFYFRRDAEGSLSKQFDKKEVYIKWLYSYKSYVKSFFNHFSDEVAKEFGRKALSKYYCSSYPNNPDLLKECKNEINKLGFKSPSPYGSSFFIFVSNLLGVDNALRLNYIKRKVTGK